MLSEGVDIKLYPKQFWHTSSVWWKVLMVVFYLQIGWEICELMSLSSLFLTRGDDDERHIILSFSSSKGGWFPVIPLKKLLYTCLARTVSNILFCYARTPRWLGWHWYECFSFQFAPARLPCGLTPVSCPECCCWSTSWISGLLVMQQGLSRSCRLLADSRSWSEINWHNVNLWRWCQKEEQKTSERAKSKYDVKLSVGILQMERFYFSFIEKVASPCSHPSFHLQLLRLVASRTLWLSLARRGSMLYVTIKGSSCHRAASSVRLANW